MPSDAPLAPGDLLALTGMSTDVLTFWGRRGLVRPLDATRVAGQHRRFAYYEANIAAVLLQLRDFGANSDTLTGIATVYREAIAWGQSLGLTFDSAMAIIMHMKAITAEATAAKARDKEFDLDAYQTTIGSLRMGQQGHFRLTDELIQQTLTMNVTDYSQHSTAFAEIMMQPVSRPLPFPTYFWRTADRWKRGDGKEGQLRASGDGAFATIAIDIVGILYNVWNPPEAKA